MKKTLLLIAVGLLSSAISQAVTEAYSPPIGGVTLSVPASQTRSLTLPLLHAPVGAGAVIGTLTGVGSNYIDAAGANWTPGALSAAANPYYLRIKTGSSAGRVMIVTTTANTDSRVYVNNDGLDLTVSGPVNGDAYELVLADTLLSFFGASTLTGGATADVADNVLIWGGASWQTYYYNTTRSRWELRGLTSLSANNVVLRPDRGFMITRRAATELKMYVSGRVPDLQPKYFHSRSGVTFLSSGIPPTQASTQTLGALSLQTRAEGWLSGTSVSDADSIQVWGGASWQKYYYSSANNRWQLQGLPTLSANNADLTNRPIMIRRLNSAPAANSMISMPMPYTIN